MTEHPSNSARIRVRPTNAFEAFPRSALEGTLVDRFEERVRRHPRRAAIIDAGRLLSFAELDREANRVANALLRVSGPVQGPVGLCFPQGWRSLVATIGVLKAGAAYVPFDHRLEPDRLRGLAASLGIVALIADAERAAAFEGVVPVPVIDADAIDAPGTSPDRSTGPGDPAYVFITSGSTGPAKGVVDTHRNVLHNVLRYTNSLHICGSDRLSLIQAPSFSATVSTTFCGLLNGATLLPFDLDREGAHALPRWLAERDATMFHSVPALFRHLLTADEPLDRLRVIRLEGDRATQGDIEGFQRRFGRGCILVNGLGATECGLIRQFFVDHRVQVPAGPVPIGEAVDDMEVMLLDSQRRRVNDGEVGEIVVRSSFLALGYHGRPDLTAAVFSAAPDQPGLRDYRTGDLGRFGADGILEFLGRVHDQPRLAGVPIDLAAVETALEALPGVDQAAALIYEPSVGAASLVAYLVPAATLPSSADMRALLAARLPSDHVPHAFVPMDRLPRTVNGKLDRGALPDPPRTRPHGAPPAARAGTLLEHELVAIWEEVLSTRPIGVRDHFVDLGGTSLQAFEILQRVERMLERSVRPSVLLDGATIERLAASLQNDVAVLDGVLLPAEGGGEAGPLFFLHGDYLSGGTYCLRLARALGPGRPLHVLPPVLRGEAGEPLSYEAMAGRHLVALRKARPRGPYLLAGNCNGGIVALEVARLLVRDGERVELLAVITASMLNRRWSTRYGPIGLAGAVMRRGPVARFDHFRAWVLRWDSRTGPERGRALLGAIHRTIARRTPKAVGRPAEDPFKASRHVLRTADRDYRPRPYEGRVVVLWPREDPEFAQAPRWWDGMAREVDFRPLPGNHVTCIIEHVDALAFELRACLEGAAARGLDK